LPLPRGARRTVLTTGANSGIGLATVIELSRRGFDSVGSVRSAAKARQVRRAATEAGAEVRTVLLDVNDGRVCEKVISRLRPWGLVNNAGFGPVGAIEDVDDREAVQVMETMVIAPMRLARLAIPNMRASGGGRIVNLSSIYGLTTTPLSGWYQAAKHAIEALSDALRVEVAHDRIRVIVVEPGGFDTAIWDRDRVREGSRYREAYKRVDLGVRLSRPFMGDPKQVAHTVGRALTASHPHARYMVGLDAQAMALWHRVVPSAVKDRVTRLGLGL
jgi:NAD(P)-dependent dehydrogenase (short-subunit alcohol dehydrogenase family)